MVDNAAPKALDRLRGSSGAGAAGPCRRLTAFLALSALFVSADLSPVHSRAFGLDTRTEAGCALPDWNRGCGLSGRRWKLEGAKQPWSLRAQGDDLRFELRAGDRWDSDVRQAHKAERIEVQDPVHQPLGQDIWLRFSMMVEPGPKTSGKWVELGQLRGLNPGGRSLSPAWAQGLDRNDVFRVLVRTDSRSPAPENPTARVLYKDPAFQRGRYYGFVYRIRYDPHGEGLVQGWRDGEQIVDYHGPVGYVATDGPFFKFGIYREATRETLAVHYRGLEISDHALSPPAVKVSSLANPDGANDARPTSIYGRVHAGLTFHDKTSAPFGRPVKRGHI